MKVYLVFSAISGFNKVFSTMEKAITYIENFVNNNPIDMKYEYSGHYTDMDTMEYSYINPISGKREIVYFYIHEAEIDAE
jgi:hypothetical protein